MWCAPPLSSDAEWLNAQQQHILGAPPDEGDRPSRSTAVPTGRRRPDQERGLNMTCHPPRGRYRCPRQQTPLRPPASAARASRTKHEGRRDAIAVFALPARKCTAGGQRGAQPRPARRPAASRLASPQAAAPSPRAAAPTSSDPSTRMTWSRSCAAPWPIPSAGSAVRAPRGAASPSGAQPTTSSQPLRGRARARWRQGDIYLSERLAGRAPRPRRWRTARFGRVTIVSISTTNGLFSPAAWATADGWGIGCCIG